jgi:RNA polymerase sigma-70 factor (ECF subfamily)
LLHALVCRQYRGSSGLTRDDTAFRTIMERHKRRLYRIARGILQNDSEAEDVVQEAYVKAFTHLEAFRGDSSLATWLSRITMNEALGGCGANVRQ